MNEDLGRRALAAGFKWMPGCASIGSPSVDALRVVDVDDGVPCSWTHGSKIHLGYGSPGWCATVWAEQLPDFNDAATLGCLLAQVQEALGFEVGTCWHADATDVCDVWHDDGTERVTFTAATLAEALVAAMEAAHARTAR